MTTRSRKMPQRAVKLPALVPGQVVTIPLELLPLYYQAHRLEAMSLGEIRKRGQNKPDGVVLVKRVDPGETGTGGDNG